MRAIVVRLSSQGSCLVLDLSVPCERVGKKLYEMNIPLDREIRIAGGHDVTYDVVGSLLMSLSDAGYLKVAFASSTKESN